MRDSWKIAINAAVLGGVLFLAATHPASGEKVLVISPTWLGYPGAISVIASADGAIVGGDTSSSFAIAFSDDPSFASRLYQAGALLVWSARVFMACDDTSKS